jgi:hypothetical protein
MQQRLFGGFHIEIAGLPQQREIREECRAGDGIGAELRIGRRQHPQPAQGQGRAKHHNQCRKNPPDSPLIEAQKAELLLIELAHDDAGDQETGNHEENVDANEAARHRLRESVKVHHQHHGDGPQAIDIRPISRCR